ncbi:LacI family DNA-binding transcriptional regulator [Schleiferilactobacillus perolens]|jgi:LacI family transcriptional regulator|uniref:LacI family DNA-binding transcriptional regulator n=1 Tax=Schleiferilactobacillus perolens TaxID=100468 RepID=UPI0023559A53|nr:LacI family DNA-binding transcriptional regulator [Schleiferilactobacillus perolens]MCI1891841.1 LacI family transcriptional regulator [Schleiferilactobacillus harbinensis]MCI1913050.1 LacI family transcriptional regulator [Schleiferilactobacillus harbinensis]MCI2170913.1 LacI family transcriptional regulator [Schleiferilactobacillus perolens]
MSRERVTLKEIARIADVSVATVSYVMNGRDIVSPQTRTKVLSIAKQLNYTPDMRAQSLRTQHSKLVFALTNALSSVFNGTILADIEDEFERHGYQLLTMQGKLPDVIQTNIFDGGIIINHSIERDELSEINHLINNKLVVLSPLPELAQASVVQMNNDQAMKQALSEMYQSKHQRVCFMQGALTSTNNIERYHSAEKYYRQFYGRDDFSIRVYNGNFDTETAYQVGRQLLTNKLYDAFVCFNDGMALGIYQAASELNLTIGKDISVIGVDNSFFSKHLTPKLTSINVDKQAWAHEVVRSYLSVGQPDHKDLLVIPTKLIKRQSIAYR